MKKIKDLICLSRLCVDGSIVGLVNGETGHVLTSFGKQSEEWLHEVNLFVYGVNPIESEAYSVASFSGIWKESILDNIKESLFDVKEETHLSTIKKIIQKCKQDKSDSNTILESIQMLISSDYLKEEIKSFSDSSSALLFLENHLDSIKIK